MQVKIIWSVISQRYRDVLRHHIYSLWILDFVAWDNLSLSFHTIWRPDTLCRSPSPVSQGLYKTGESHSKFPDGWSSYQTRENEGPFSKTILRMETDLRSSLNRLKPLLKNLTEAPASKCTWPDKCNSTLSPFDSIFNDYYQGNHLESNPDPSCLFFARLLKAY